MQKNITAALCLAASIALTACQNGGSRPPATIQKPSQQSARPAVDLNKAMAEPELFYVYEKGKDSLPKRIEGIYSNQQTALDKFRSNQKYIDTMDCIRVSTAKPETPATVCDENMWFSFGLLDRTDLTTRKLKATPGGLVEGAVGVALSPLSMAIDILSFDPEMKRTRSDLKKSTSDPVQDFEEINKAWAVLMPMANDIYHAERNGAFTGLETAVAFSKKYKGEDITPIADSLLGTAISKRSVKDVSGILRSLRTNTDQVNRSLAFFRGENSFDGYASAFDFSSDVADAKKAQALAASADDKKKTEYMAIKLVEKRRGSATDLFDISYAKDLEVSDIKEKRNNPWLFVQEEMSGLMTFKSRVKVAADRKAGIFAYGTYNVRLRATLTVPQRFVRYSAWLGNVDKQTTLTQTRETVVRLEPPSFTADGTIVFSDIRMNFKDRGSAGGTTEITPTGSPKISVEVVDVSIVQ